MPVGAEGWVKVMVSAMQCRRELGEEVEGVADEVLGCRSDEGFNVW